MNRRLNYKTVKVHDEILEDVLNQWGYHGWKLVAVVPLPTEPGYFQLFLESEV